MRPRPPPRVRVHSEVSETGFRDLLAARLAGPVDIVATSAVAGDGLDVLRALLVHPVTAALLGPSGAGKSTLINALAGEDLLPVGDVRDSDRRGRHTTTSRQLVPLPSGGSLVDMPGLRSLGTDASNEAVAVAFGDIDELAAGCRFADCAHHVEPGCAVAAAVDAGTLDPGRLASYRKVLREAAFERRRSDPLARQEDLRMWKARTSQVRRVYRDRGRGR
ncbi:MAG: ribosome small subunit-dependent GTPase A [Acidimicrobiia bacterium]